MWVDSMLVVPTGFFVKAAIALENNGATFKSSLCLKFIFILCIHLCVVFAHACVCVCLYQRMPMSLHTHVCTSHANGGQMLMLGDLFDCSPPSFSEIMLFTELGAQ